MKWQDYPKISLVLRAFIAEFVISADQANAGSVLETPNDIASVVQRSRVMGRVYVIEVTLPTREALDELIRQGYDVTGVRYNVATIYAVPEELACLDKAGYTYRQIDQQPRLEYFAAAGPNAYHDYESLTADLQDYAAAYPEICRLYTLGRSFEGRELWAMLITENPEQEEDEPEFKYVSSMHGDEPLAMEMCLNFIDLLLTGYGTDKRITDLVDGTAIWFVPLMNPDRILRSRYNAQGLNLNRLFPVYPRDYSYTFFDGEALGDAGRPPEVFAIIRWTAQNSFVLSASLHTAVAFRRQALVVCYPYDDDRKGSVDSPTPDDLLFEEISLRYSMQNTPMWNSTRFPQGIVNGAAWYAIIGSTGDWNYRYASCNEVVVEFTEWISPPASEIPKYWSENRESMLSYLEAVHIGVRGIVTDRVSGAPLWAQVLVEGNSHPVFTDPDVGDYHRMLLPGTYNLIFDCPGYFARSVKNVPVTDGPATRVDVELVPTLADFDRDGEVDFRDFSKLTQYWLQKEPSVDIVPVPNAEAMVDYQDLAFLAECWLMGVVQVEDRRLVAHWRLDETQGGTAEDSARDKDGALQGDPIWRPTGGKIYGALQLDGIDDYISTPFVLNPADGEFSVFAWIKGGGPGQVVLSQIGGVNCLLADPSAGNLMTELQGTGRGAAPLMSNFVITDGAWHRIGLVWDGSFKSLYVDDIEVVKDTHLQGQLISADGGLYFGAGKDLAAGSFFSGLIDDIRIYNRAVSP